MRDRSASEVGVLARQQQESNAEDAVGILRRIFYVLDFVLVLDTPSKVDAVPVSTSWLPFSQL